LSYISDHVIKSRKKLIVGASVIITAITAVITFAPGGLNLPLLYVFCFLLSLGASAIVVIGFTSCKELFPVSIAGTSVGLINFFPFFGGAVMQPVLGAVLDAAGPAGGPYPPESYAAAFAVCLASAVIALVASLLVEETLRD
jgi:MFS family permease